MTRFSEVDSVQGSQGMGKAQDIDQLRAADIMRREVVTVRDSDTIGEVEVIIADAGVSGVPVVTVDGRIVGVISMRDLVNQHAAGDPEPLPLPTVDDDGEDSLIEPSRPKSAEVRAADLMSPVIESTHPEVDLRTVARQMIDRNVHRVLVVEDGQLRGIISTFDLLRALASQPAPR
ncbi:MAG: CBS domain-containing protein [bacterium]|nr:CBS domain-containing protein [bacterium]